MIKEEANVKEPMLLRKRRTTPTNPIVVPANLVFFNLSFKKGMARQNTKSG
jgi:hypothetical protein